MTEANAGSASSDAAAVNAAVITGNAGTPAATNSAAAATNGSGKSDAADPFAGLETGTREWVGTKGYKSVGDIAKAAQNAESLIGKSVQIPDADAKPEDWDKFYGKVGRPEKSDGYEFKLPDGVPKEMPYDGEFANGFKPIAHQLGLTAKQAAGVHDFYVGQAAGYFGKQSEAKTQQVVAATAALEEKWGPSGSEAFQAKVDSSIRALKGLGIEEDLRAAGLMSSVSGPEGKTYNVVTHPKIAMALAEIGSKLFREDGLVTGQGGAVVDNPFKDGPGKGNITDQMVAIRKDKAGAIRSMRAAGHKPEDFGLTE